MKLPYNEQALIAGESIYALPRFNYKDITVDMFYIANQNTKTYGALGGQEHCRVTLRHFGREFYVHLNTNSGIQIMYVNDQDESLNQTYTLVQED